MMGEVIRVSGRAPDVGEFLREAMLSQRFADVALCCPGGQRFLAHRLVLSAASPYLQEVLLAHSKSTTHCEPITVILAEVEAPELAAILGFVYTGSATVPRPRLDAFIRAAEALHIRLPAVPVVMTCSETNCKLEDVKDVKISPKYLQCDQYPSCNRWYRSGRIIQEDRMNKKESYPGTSANDASEVTIRSHPDTTNLPGSRYSPSRLHSSNTWTVPSFPGVDQDKGPQNIKEPVEKDEMNPVNIRRYHPTTVLPRTDRTSDMTDKNLENKTLGSGCDTSVNTCQDPYLSRDLVDVHGRLDPLELRLKGDYARLQTTAYTNSKFVYEEEMYERSLMMNEMSSDGERARDRIGAIRSRDGSFQSRTASLQYTGRTRSYEKPDYGQTGEDLTCGESCCRWRIPKRHVANRVTASPWRQIVRPHHSPKLQPIVLQTHTDDTEVVESVHVPETLRSTTSLSSPTRQSPKNTTTTDGFYGFEAPTTCELNFNNNVRPLESTVASESRVQPFYTPPVPYSTSPQTTLPIPATTNHIRNNETFFHATTSPTNRTVVTPNENVPLLNANKKDGYFPQVLPQTPTKPELSHPISRLCDTIDSAEKSDNFVNLEVKKLDDEVKGEEKVTGRTFVNSDSNNNDSIVSNDVSQRGKSTGGQDDHRCDQCGKTFVTRASLKVHSRTHSGEKPFRCADCGKQFSQLRNYKYHRSVHEGTREFAATCPECGKYFNDRGYLSSHMKIHRNRKEYGCAECGKSFNQRVAYNMHVRIHTGVKPHQCEQCGKAFSRKMLLKQHLRTHSGERPYQCQVCQKAFADRSNMTLHTRLHSGLKPYQCTLCSKAFTKKHHLKTHLNYHTGTKPYSCPNCGLRFSQSSNMRTHYKKCTINNPGGVKSTQNSGDNMESTKIVEVQVISRTATDALTPPNSDQESSILTPISKTAGGEVNLT